jgi:hypothetical protein
MKKIIGISVVAVLAVLVFGIVGLAFAQDSTPTQPVQANPNGQAAGVMGGGRWGGQRGGRMAPGSGLLHDQVVASLADAFGMAPEALQARLDNGETLWQVAESLGWTSEQLQTAMLDARSAALQQALADGSMTQEQADWMAQRMNQGWPEGYGPGSANCDGSGQMQGRHGGRGMGMGSRWQNQPAP